MKAFFKTSKRLTVSVVGHNDPAKKIHARKRVTTSPSLQARQSSHSFGSKCGESQQRQSNTRSIPVGLATPWTRSYQSSDRHIESVTRDSGNLNKNNAAAISVVPLLGTGLAALNQKIVNQGSAFAVEQNGGSISTNAGEPGPSYVDHPACYSFLHDLQICCPPTRPSFCTCP